ncbi:MAG: tRNA pseudouridine(55) synthase TruB [Gammaproteobacteria bacterium]|nr:tRNA pseudouridine(55) synthase TruB [Gammaproteobacteria bacterium]
MARRPPQYRRPPARDIHGIVLLDKPLGLSSNQALQQVRTLFEAEKAGHTGALDPLATGLLPICLGEATKIAGLLLSEAKAYHTRVQLGIETDTDDAEGHVTRERPVPPLSDEIIELVLAQIRGRIRQVPPRYSALKRDGEPLYLRARRGEEFEVPAREVEVFSLTLKDAGPDWLELEVECGSGTYIRSLARDIGDALGCGGHVTVLRRLWVEPFRQPQMQTLEELKSLAGQGREALDAVLLPLEAGLAGYPTLRLDAADVRRFGQGQVLRAPQLPPDQLVVVCDAHARALGLASADAAGKLRIQRLFRWAVVRGDGGSGGVKPGGQL